MVESVLGLFYTIYPICLSMISAEHFVTPLSGIGGVASSTAPMALKVAKRNVRNLVLFAAHNGRKAF